MYVGYQIKSTNTTKTVFAGPTIVTAKKPTVESLSAYSVFALEDMEEKTIERYVLDLMDYLNDMDASRADFPDRINEFRNDLNNNLQKWQDLEVESAIFFACTSCTTDMKIVLERRDSKTGKQALTTAIDGTFRGYPFVLGRVENLILKVDMMNAVKCRAYVVDTLEKELQEYPYLKRLGVKIVGRKCNNLAQQTAEFLTFALEDVAKLRNFEFEVETELIETIPLRWR